MFARIAAFLASAAKFIGQVGIDLVNGLPTVGRWLDDIISWPFRTLFGGSQAQPSYTPEYQTADLLDVLKEARQDAKAKVTRLDRNGIDSVLAYARAHRDDRATMRLPKSLDPRVRAALLTMDDAALRKLHTAGIGQVRRFVDGMPHGIPGVPAFGENLTTAANDIPPKGLSTHEQMLWKIRAQLLKNKESEPFHSPRAARP
ncbi:hypothetical protein Kim5_CH00757 [Rhizobium sp. Kim5]|uniref:hypothetical protein n=1 Tax=Rhizobium sp. Kim5 TaxID=2020311 RepID=UPI0001904D8F|nr:hypothetical protein [Rhizobium sp. Kim5]ARQ56865.1 hypothetical protein Kim5_CH00757 [Rhizobium sp. Kim5]